MSRHLGGNGSKIPMTKFLYSAMNEQRKRGAEIPPFPGKYFVQVTFKDSTYDSEVVRGETMNITGINRSMDSQAWMVTLLHSVDVERRRNEGDGDSAVYTETIILRWSALVVFKEIREIAPATGPRPLINDFDYDVESAVAVDVS